MKHTRDISLNVAVVIVTYADRSVYFKEIIHRLKSFKSVKSIVLVDNFISESSSTDLEKLKLEIDKITVVEKGYNSGSAEGFKDGISKALDQSIDFIWLLDDDNLPRADALDNLISHWKEISLKGVKDFALLCYRPDRLIFKEAIEVGDPNMMLGPKNSFLGFHFIKKIQDLSKFKKTASKNRRSFGKVSVAPYGGLFFHRSLTDIIGLPDENYFLYGDDYDYSFRITQKGGGIFLVLRSVVEDLEQSFHLKNKNEKFLSSRLIKTNSENRIFYSIRNGIVFEQNFVTNKVIYILNGFCHAMLTLLVLVLNPKHLWKYKYYIKGIKASIW